MQSNKIKEIYARSILDSRGNHTIEVDVLLYNGSIFTKAPRQYHQKTSVQSTISRCSPLTTT